MPEHLYLNLILFGLSFGLTYLARVYALRRTILDVPNERSSHQIPTPRGGGIAIAITFFAGLAYLALQKLIPSVLAFALIGGGFFVALAGYLDDNYQLAISWRLLGQIVGAALALYFLSIKHLLLFKDISCAMHSYTYLLLLVMIVWLTNLYNFMDGIDGLAASQTIFVGLAVCLLVNGTGVLANSCWVLIAAAYGFLLWNWPPAKIFMGDVSSGLLGFSWAVLSIYSAGKDTLPLITWYILLAVFIIDASYTLIRRFLAGEKWYAAHRSHAYQRLTQHGFSHLRVTLMVIGFNTILILPLALLSQQSMLWSIAAGCVTLIVCSIVWLRIIIRYKSR